MTRYQVRSHYTGKPFFGGMAFSSRAEAESYWYDTAPGVNDRMEIRAATPAASMLSRVLNRLYGAYNAITTSGTEERYPQNERLNSVQPVPSRLRVPVGPKHSQSVRPNDPDRAPPTP